MTRIEEIRHAMTGMGFDAILIDSPFGVLYAVDANTSFNYVEISPVLVVTEKKIYLIGDVVTVARLYHHVDDSVHIIEAETDLWIASGYRYLEELRSIVKGEDIQHLALTGDRYDTDILGCAAERIADIVAEMAMVKTEGEIQSIRRAVVITEAAFTETMGELREGITELHLRGVIDQALINAGGERRAFPTRVAFGEHTADMHPIPQNRTLQRGDLVLVDMGAVYRGYGADLTRTVCFGEPDVVQREVHKVVLEAQERAIDFIAIGRLASEVDAVAREYIRSRGYGQSFLHELGHPCGLMRSGTTLGPTSNDIIRTNMVFTVEPGIYMPGWGGVRIEDVVMVTEGGCEILTSVSRDLVLPD
jgi:Xaa-Pro aminopeptidase